MKQLNKVKQVSEVETKKVKVTVDHSIDLDSVIKSVRAYESGTFIHLDYRVSSQYRIDGKERTRFSTGVVFSKRALQRVEREKYTLALEHYLANTQIIDEAKLTIDDIAMDAIEDDRTNRQNDVHNDYIQIYNNSIKPSFGKMLLSVVKVSDVKLWKSKLLKNHPMSKSRYAKFHQVLNFIFKYALENEMIDRNPAALVDKKSKLFTKSKIKAGEKYYSTSDVKKMLEHATGWFRVMLLTYLNTGMRTGEGLGLHWKDIDFEKSTITIQRSIRKGKIKDGTKTGENRVILMSQVLKDALLLYKDTCKSDIWLFPNPKTGKPYYEANSITRWYFKPLLEKLGIEFRTFYALRHTFASIAAQNNIPITVISKQLGHSNINVTTSFYIQHNLLDEAQNRDVFDSLYA